MKEKSKWLDTFKIFLSSLIGKDEEKGEQAVRRAERVGLFFHRLFVHNAWLKLTALIFAVILWSYIVTDTNPVLRKIYNNIPVSIVGMDELRSSGMTLSDDIENINLVAKSVMIDMSFSSSLTFSADSIMITVDVSDITATGKNKIFFKGQTSSGTIVKTDPSYIEVDVSKYIEMSVPVNYTLSNALPSNVVADTPSLSSKVIKIGGPKEYIQNVTGANVDIDLSSVKEGTFPRALPYTLRNIYDEEVTVPNLITYDSIITVSMKVQSKKTVPIDISSNLSNYDKLAEGYELSSVTTYPQYVTLIGSEVQLSKIDAVQMEEYIDLKNAKKDVTGTYQLNIPDGISAEDDLTEAHVFIEIVEKRATVYFTGIKILAYNTGNKEISMNVTTANFSAQVPYFSKDKITKDDIILYIDVTNQNPGSKTQYAINYAIKGKEDQTDFARNVVITPSSVEVTVVASSGG